MTSWAIWVSAAKNDSSRYTPRATSSRSESAESLFAEAGEQLVDTVGKPRYPTPIERERRLWGTVLSGHEAHALTEQLRLALAGRRCSSGQRRLQIIWKVHGSFLHYHILYHIMLPP